ncbi:MAG: FAD/NAD(P)-binding oxidoreductase [Reichenbachiella sp.]|uniref:NAD(P)/FAD-dependent oxidoreductase n=1 Tax=Reichenbachiella sp. TaxID=2184521 RepID=UPI0032634B4B
MPDNKHVVIIGNGISGITAARHLRKHSKCRITVISGESDYFYSRTALMYVYMGHMKFENTKPYEDWFWKKNEIDLVKAWVQEVDTKEKRLKLDGVEDITYDVLVLATGSVSNKFGWPGQEAKGVSSLYHKQDLEYIEEYSSKMNRAVIVGGGLIGIELAEMLHSRQIDVTLLVREENFWDVVMPLEEAQMINQEIRDHHIDLRLTTELKEIKIGEDGAVVGVVTNQDEQIECQFVGLTVGVSPNVKWLAASGLEIKRGIVVNEFLETNIADVYAIGDCAEHNVPSPGRRPVEQVWYTGRMMGEVVAQTILGNPTAYKPGIWFNSAKFFNIEYQTYGTVTPTLAEGHDQFFWQTDDGKISFRVVFDASDRSVLGLNVLGIRMRHEVWDEWIRNGEKIEVVMAQLERANFDPEFFNKYEYAIREIFNQKFEHLAIENQKPSLLKRIFS